MAARGSLPSALASAWRRCAQQPALRTLLRHAIELHQSGDIAGATAAYRAYLKRVPKNVMARSNLGAALARAGQYEEAIVEYRKALELDRAICPCGVNLALAYYKTAQISEAAGGTDRGRGSSSPPTARPSSCWPIATCAWARIRRWSNCCRPWKRTPPTTRR